MEIRTDPIPALQGSQAMRILVISALYPPAVIGGAERRCKELVDGLKNKGHLVYVLTSDYDSHKSAPDRQEYRELSFRNNFSSLSHLQKALIEFRDNRRLISRCGKVQPDLILVCNMHHLSKAILETTHRLGKSVVYDVSADWALDQFRNDPWLGYWRHIPSHRLKRILKRCLLSLLEGDWNTHLPVKLKKFAFNDVYFISDDLLRLHRDAGYQTANARVIRSGISLAAFSCQGGRRFDEERLRLIYAGQVVEHKGVHTIIESLGLLKTTHGVTLPLDIYGPVISEEYLNRLTDIIERFDLQASVRFKGLTPRDVLLNRYREYDALILATITEEPFSRAVLEAMAAGLLVVGTTTGGTKEILIEGQTGLTFNPGDARDLARQLLRAETERNLCISLSKNAKTIVENEYRIERMIDEVEVFLKGVLQKQ